MVVCSFAESNATTAQPRFVESNAVAAQPRFAESNATTQPSFAESNAREDTCARGGDTCVRVG